MKRFVIATLSLLVGVSTFAANEVERPNAYGVQFPLQIAPNAGLQRATLPPLALAAIQSWQLADIRVFNGKGEAVPLALLPLRTESNVAAPRAVAIYPINATEQQQQVLSGLQLRIDESAGRRIVTVDSGGKAAPSSNTTKQVGALVDTQSFTGKLESLIVDAELPIGEPVSLTVSASKDLKNWRTLANASPVFRFGGEGAPGNLRVPLGNVTLDKEYLRVTWPVQPAFVLRAVRITETPTSATPPRVELPLVAVLNNSTDELIVVLPFATPLQGLLVRAGPGNALAPIRIDSRNAKSEPWRNVTTSTIYRIASNGSESVNPPIELNGLVARELRIKADRNPSAFADGKFTVQAIINPISIAFVASGNPPFTLAIGNKDAKPIALPISSVIPGYKEGDEAALAQAKVDTANSFAAPVEPPSTLTAIKEKVGAPSERSLLLWGVLIGGVLLLGAIAWSMLKSTAKIDTDKTNG